SQWTRNLAPVPIFRAVDGINVGGIDQHHYAAWRPISIAVRLAERWERADLSRRASPPDDAIERRNAIDMEHHHRRWLGNGRRRGCRHAKSLDVPNCQRSVRGLGGFLRGTRALKCRTCPQGLYLDAGQRCQRLSWIRQD